MDRLHDAFRQVGAQRREALAGKRLQFPVEPLVHRQSLLLAPLQLRHVGIRAIGVALPRLVHKGVMDVHPNFIALKRQFANRQTVCPVFRLMMAKQIRNCFMILRMDGTHGSATFQADKICLLPLHHFRKFLRTPDRITGTVLLHPQHHGVIVQLPEQPLVKACFEIQHNIYPIFVSACA